HRPAVLPAKSVPGQVRLQSALWSCKIYSPLKVPDEEWSGRGPRASCGGLGFAHASMKFSPLPGAGQVRGHALAEGFGAERPAEIGGARGRIGNHALQRVVDGGGRAEQRLMAS